MELGEIGSKHHILERSQQNIRIMFPKGHTAFERAALHHAGTEHRVGFSAQDGLDEVGDDARVILIIRMAHDHDVGAVLERSGVAGFLVSAVTDIFFVDVDGQA